MLTLAFELLTEKKYNINSNKKIILVKKLAEFSGHTGMAGGQYLDLSYEKKISVSKIIEMQKKKTGKLFEFCFLAPAILAGLKINKINSFGKIGEEVGLLFQIADDLLDLKGLKKNVGKSVNKDKRKRKIYIN